MSLSLRKKYIMSLQQATQPSGRLPAGYQEVEYIASSGTQFIKTGVDEFQKLKTETDFQFTSYSNNNEHAMGGIYSYDSNTKSCRMEIVEIYKPKDNYFGFGANGGFFSSTIIADTARHKVEIDNVNGYIKCDGNSVATFTTTTSSPSGTNKDLYLFAYHAMDNYGYSAAITHCSLKLYSCKIWKSGTLEREFVPCYRKADGEIGLYDLVNDVFYTNQGSGVFTKGANINVPAHDSVLENNSWDTIKAVIDSGYKPTSWLGQTKEILSGTYSGYHCQLVDLQSNRYQKSDNSGYTNAVFSLLEITPTSYAMNSTNDNTGGYAQCSGRTTLNTTVYNALPQELKDIIVQVKIGSSSSGSDATITYSDNYLFPACEYEITGTTTYAKGGSAEGSPQYDYYVNNTNARTKYVIGTTTAQYWATRSPRNNFSYQYVIINGATVDGGSASSTYLRNFCFAI